MTLRLTNSEAKSWRRCKRQWMLDYYFGYQRKGSDPYNKPLSIGSRVHDVLAFYYEPGDHYQDRAAAMAHFKTGVEADLEKDVSYKKDIKKEADLCEAMLDGYFDWLEEEGHDASIEVIAPEAEMEVPLTEGTTLLSKIDARVRDVESGDIGAFEHKTVQSLTDPMRRLQVDTQLLTEHLVEFLHQRSIGSDDRAEFVLYNMLRKVKRTKAAKPPFFGREHVRHNVDELRSHWRHVARVVFEIQSARAELDAGASHHDVCYPNPTPDCTWDCAFSDVCLSGLMDDGSDYQAAIDEKFEAGDPLERYRSSVGLMPRGGATAEVDSEE